MTKILFNNISNTPDSYIEDYSIHLYSEDKEEVAVFQFCKITDSNEFYLERGKYVESNNSEDSIFSPTYFIKVNTSEFSCELSEVKIEAMGSCILPSKKVFINSMSGIYKELVRM